MSRRCGQVLAVGPQATALHVPAWPDQPAVGCRMPADPIQGAWVVRERVGETRLKKDRGMTISLHRRTWMAALITAPALARTGVTLDVVTSFSILADMTRRIAGSFATVRSLVP